MKPDPEASADDSQNVDAGDIIDLLEMDSESLSQHLHDFSRDNVSREKRRPLDGVTVGGESRKRTQESVDGEALSTSTESLTVPVADGMISSLQEIQEWKVSHIENMKSALFTSTQSVARSPPKLTSFTSPKPTSYASNKSSSYESSKTKSTASPDCKGKKKVPRRYRGLTEVEARAMRLKTNKMEKERNRRQTNALKTLKNVLPNCLKEEMKNMTQLNVYKTTTAYTFLLTLCKAFNASMHGEAFKYGLKMIQDCQRAHWDGNLIDTTVFDHLLEKHDVSFFKVLKEGISYDVCSLMVESGSKYASPLLHAFQTETASFQLQDRHRNNFMLPRPVVSNPRKNHKQQSVMKRRRRRPRMALTATVDEPPVARHLPEMQTNQDAPSMECRFDSAAPTIPWLQHIYNNNTPGFLVSNLASQSSIPPTYPQPFTLKGSMVHAYQHLQLAAASNLGAHFKEAPQTVAPSSLLSGTVKSEHPLHIQSSHSGTPSDVAKKLKSTANELSLEGQTLIKSAENVDLSYNSSLTLQRCDKHNKHQASSSYPNPSMSAPCVTTFDVSVPADNSSTNPSMSAPCVTTFDVSVPADNSSINPSMSAPCVTTFVVSVPADNSSINPSMPAPCVTTFDVSVPADNSSINPSMSAPCVTTFDVSVPADNSSINPSMPTPCVTTFDVSVPADNSSINPSMPAPCVTTFDVSVPADNSSINPSMPAPCVTTFDVSVPADNSTINPSMSAPRETTSDVSVPADNSTINPSISAPRETTSDVSVPADNSSINPSMSAPCVTTLDISMAPNPSMSVPCETTFDVSVPVSNSSSNLSMSASCETTFDFSISVGDSSSNNSMSASRETTFDSYAPASCTPGHSSSANHISLSSSAKRKTRKPMKLKVLDASGMFSDWTRVGKEKSKVAFTLSHSREIPSHRLAKRSLDCLPPAPASSGAKFTQARYRAANVSIVKPNIRQVKTRHNNSVLHPDPAKPTLTSLEPKHQPTSQAN